MKSVELKLPDIDLSNYANIDNSKDQYSKTYQYIRRLSKPIGFFESKEIILKLYHMLRESEPLPQNLVDGLEEFIKNELQKGYIDTREKVGFAILSQGFLSINIWGRGNVLFTYTYTIEDTYPELSLKTLEKTGVACTWEIRIMRYEYDLWQSYLESDMKICDKKRYLRDFISGELF
jgi:hypothetical protein